MTFGQKIRELRQGKDWSVYDLAGKIKAIPPYKATAGYISKIEVRGEIPSPDMILRLAEVLNADAGDLIELAKNEKSQEVSRNVKRKYDDAFALYRKSPKKRKR